MPQMVEKNSLGLYLAGLERAALNSGNSISLFQNDVNPTVNMSPGDFTVANYDGFAKIPLSFGPVFVDAAGELCFIATGQFVSSAPNVVTNSCYGLLLETTAGAPLEAGRFPVPVGMGSVGNAINFAIEWRNGQVSFVTLP